MRANRIETLETSSENNDDGDNGANIDVVPFITCGFTYCFG